MWQILYNVRRRRTVVVVRHYWFSFIASIELCCLYYNCKVFGLRAMNEHVNLVVEQYEFGVNETGEFIRFHGRVSKNVQGGLQQRKVDVKDIIQYAQESNPRCVVKLFKEYMRCVPSTGRFYRKPLRSTEPGDLRFGGQHVGINTLSKYLKAMCTAANINMEGQYSDLLITREK